MLGRCGTSRRKPWLLLRPCAARLAAQPLPSPSTSGLTAVDGENTPATARAATMATPIGKARLSASTTKQVNLSPTRKFTDSLRMFRMLPERFQKRIASDLSSSFQGTPCWMWTGEMNRNGYGRVWWKRARRVAHRAVWEWLFGDIAEGLLLDHRCSNRCCVNPLHLEPVTPKENTQRGKAVLFRRNEDATVPGMPPSNGVEWDGSQSPNVPGV